jgi:hypothetical protein
MPEVRITWIWDEAFLKFGFGDGDGWNGTHEIECWFESEMGWKPESHLWGIHNYMIFALTDPDGKKYEFNGYDSPRKTLPEKVVSKLDERFK